MSRTGIVAEFNPFHFGHEYIIRQAKQNGDEVVCAVSGNFVQRGDAAVIGKADRVKAALCAGADLVVEIPSVYSMSTAQNFALAGVWQLYNMGCDKIVFGSESGNTEKIIKTAEILLSDAFAAELSKLSKLGETFAKSREKAAVSLGADKEILLSPNDNLAVEYVLAAKKLKLDFLFCAVKRKGDTHDGTAPQNEFASGSFIRELIKNGDFEAAEKYLPTYVRPFITKENTADISRIEPLILGILRLKTKEELSLLPDISEGIENRLYEAIKTAASLEELYEAVKTKRYTLSRVRRLVLSAFLGFDNSFFMVVPPYTRLLGASDEGLKMLKSTLSLNPVITKAADIEKLDEFSKKLFYFENKASDMHGLCFCPPRPAKSEYTMKFIKKNGS